MSKKTGERLPQNSGENSGYKNYYSIKSPWEKLICYRDALHYASRYESVLSAAVNQAFRIMIPDYEERAEFMCQDAFKRLLLINQMYGINGDAQLNMHPFMSGQYCGALIGDEGDDMLLMCGRVQDFGTYRAEKELDVCDWDVVGSELCRATTMSLKGCATGTAERRRPGPTMEYCMVEAKGCGDRHCRIVAESREKYPMPEHMLWESFGPVATADQIKFTEEEDCVKESMVFREECNYLFQNGTNLVEESDCATMVRLANASALYILPAIEAWIREGNIEEKAAMHIIRCVCEAAGKAAFGEYYARKACRDWLGVPDDVGEDGRVLGGLIEMLLQALTCPYEVEAFNEEEVIYVINRAGLELGGNKLVPECHVYYWYGMARTLINAQWFLWEEDSPEGGLRIKIAKKIDKFC
ncbi:MAG: hypothetical protein FWG03_03245 [Clostridiales bacterium]|nr:hypothetical protein [Clostridiales bacterium]